MKKFTILFFVIILSIAFSSKWLYAVKNDYDWYKAGARLKGLGGTFIGIADNTDALYSNPAGLSFLERKEFSTTWGEESNSGLQYGLFNYVGRTFGLGCLLLRKPDIYGQIPSTEENHSKTRAQVIEPQNLSFQVGEGESSFEQYRLISNVRASFALPLTDFFSLGATVQMEDFQDPNFSGDIGAMFKVKKFLGFGAVLQEVKASDNLEDISGGLGMHLTLAPLTIGAEIENIDQNNIDQTNYRFVFRDYNNIRCGVELSLAPIILRGGVYGNLEDYRYWKELNYTAGLGLRVAGWNLDYAYLRHSNSDREHLISLASSLFGKDQDGAEPSDALFLPLDGLKKNSIGHDNDKVDWWKVDVPQKGNLKIKLDKKELNLYLYDANVAPILESSTKTRGKVLNSDLPSSGTYFVKIQSFASKASSYKLSSSFTPEDTDGSNSDKAMTISLNDRIENSLNPVRNDRVDWWKTEVKKKGKLKASIIEKGIFARTELKLLSKGLSEIEDTSSDPKKNELEADLSEGIYYLKIYTLYSEASDYTLRTEFTPEDDYATPEEAKKLLPSLTQVEVNNSLNLKENDKVDWFKIKTPTGGKLEVKVKADKTASLNLTLHNPQGKELTKFKKDYTKNKVSVEKLPAGEYCLKVSPKFSQVATDYRLLYQFTPLRDTDGVSRSEAIPFPAFPINMRKEQIELKVENNLDYDANDKADWWKLEVPIDGRLEVKVEALKSDEDLNLALYDKELAKYVYTMIPEATIEKLERGSYYVEVYTTEKGTAVSYSLSSSLFPPLKQSVKMGSYTAEVRDYRTENSVDNVLFVKDKTGKVLIKLIAGDEGWASLSLNELSGEDITGDGNPELIVERSYEEKSDSRLKIFSLSDSSLKEIPIKTPKWAVPLVFNDLNSDSIYELLAEDIRFKNFPNTDDANPPQASVVLSYEEGEYVPSSSRFFEYYRGKIERLLYELKGIKYDQSKQLSIIISILLNYIHSGKSDKGWSEFRRLYTRNDRDSVEESIKRILQEDSDGATRDKAITLELDAKRRNSLNWEDNDKVDWWRVELPAKGTLRLSLREHNTSLNLAVYDEKGAELVALSGKNNIEAELLKLPKAIYYVEVLTHIPEEDSSYTIESTFRRVRYGYLRVKKVDPWAYIFIDGVKVETTPYGKKIPVEEGKRLIELNNPILKEKYSEYHDFEEGEVYILPKIELR